jgi:predicted  nucleic acid-binding Zn-ribbon protein
MPRGARRVKPTQTEESTDMSTDTVENVEAVQADENAAADEAKYAGMSRSEKAANKRLDLAKDKLARLNKRLKAAEAEYETVQKIVAEKRPNLVAAIARGEVQVKFYAAQEQAEKDAVAAALGETPAEDNDDVVGETVIDDENFALAE